MPNTELTRLMELSAIHPDDRPEVERIFACLTEERRMAVLTDWPRMAERIKRINGRAGSRLPVAALLEAQGR